MLKLFTDTGSGSTQPVQMYCTQGTQHGKYMVVKPNLDVIAGSTSDGDTVFHRDNVQCQVGSFMHKWIEVTHCLCKSQAFRGTLNCTLSTMWGMVAVWMTGMCSACDQSLTCYRLEPLRWRNVMWGSKGLRVHTPSVLSFGKCNYHLERFKENIYV